MDITIFVTIIAFIFIAIITAVVIAIVVSQSNKKKQQASNNFYQNNRQPPQYANPQYNAYPQQYMPQEQAAQLDQTVRYAQEGNQTQLDQTVMYSQQGQPMQPPGVQYPQQGQPMQPPGVQYPQQGQPMQPPGVQYPQQGQPMQPPGAQYPQQGQPVPQPGMQGGGAYYPIGNAQNPRSSISPSSKKPPLLIGSAACMGASVLFYILNYFINAISRPYHGYGFFGYSSWGLSFSLPSILSFFSLVLVPISFAIFVFVVEKKQPLLYFIPIGIRIVVIFFSLVINIYNRGIYIAAELPTLLSLAVLVLFLVTLVVKGFNRVPVVIVCGLSALWSVYSGVYNMITFIKYSYWPTGLALIYFAFNTITTVLFLASLALFSLAPNEDGR